MRSTGVLSGGMGWRMSWRLVGAVVVGGVYGSARAGMNGDLKILAGMTPGLVAGFGAAGVRPVASLDAIVARDRRSENVPSPGTAALFVLGGVVVMQRQRR